jgi:putative peptide zinc metalloprotease protein
MSSGSATPHLPAERWCRTPGTRELGSAQGSGFREQRYLLRRGDGQVVQVSKLLGLVVHEVSAERDPAQVAAAVSAAYGRELSVDGLRRLIREKLEPFGLVQGCGLVAAPMPYPVPRADPLLSVRFRRTLLPVAVVRRCAGVMAPLLRTEVMLVAALAAVAADVLVIRRGGVIVALNQVLATPAFLLALLLLLTLGALLHELGHAAACAYGGARPGAVGLGVYLVFPVFFTDVTDSYRLDRAGRIRTDLGGLYINVWCVIALDVAYLGTHQGLLLLTALLMHVEMAQQLIPTVRFDGYFVLSDLAGVPDLFARVRPVLRSLVPGRPTDPNVRELRPAARRIVVAWVLAVVPLLTVAFGWLVYNLPQIVRRTVTAIVNEADVTASAWRERDVIVLALAALSIVLLTVPLLGLAELARQLTVRGLRLAHVPLPPRNRDPVRPSHAKETAMTDATSPAPDGLTAASLTDEAILGPPPVVPGAGWRRTVYRATSGAINPGPGAAEKRRAELIGRVTAPINGSRRVVVMSRKGGVGKTTTTLALGSTYAALRGDRVVAVDANPDAGNLAHRASKPCTRTITDLIADIGLISSYSDLRGYTAQVGESRLEVLASDDDPRIGMALDRDAYHRVIDLLDHYYNLILLDTGTGILDSANQGLLAEADQLVLVLRPAVDGARAAALTLDWLCEHGYGELVTRAVVVVNGVRGEKQATVERIEAHFTRRCATVVTVPWDRALEGGGRTTLSALRPATLDALTNLAAAVADAFTAGPSVRTVARDLEMS